MVNQVKNGEWLQRLTSRLQLAPPLKVHSTSRVAIKETFVVLRQDDHLSFAKTRWDGAEERLPFLDEMPMQRGLQPLRQLLFGAQGVVSWQWDPYPARHTPQNDGGFISKA